MAFDIDDDELRATREMNKEDKFVGIQEKWIVEFVKNQEEFVKQECLNYLAGNKIVRTFKIDRDTLEYIFNLGLKEYREKYCKRGEK